MNRFVTPAIFLAASALAMSAQAQDTGLDLGGTGTDLGLGSDGIDPAEYGDRGVVDSDDRATVDPDIPEPLEREPLEQGPFEGTVIEQGPFEDTVLEEGPFTAESEDDRLTPDGSAAEGGGPFDDDAAEIGGITDDDPLLEDEFAPGAGDADPIDDPAGPLVESRPPLADQAAGDEAAPSMLGDDIAPITGGGGDLVEDVTTE